MKKKTLFFCMIFYILVFSMMSTAVYANGSYSKVTYGYKTYINTDQWGELYTNLKSKYENGEFDANNHIDYEGKHYYANDEGSELLFNQTEPIEWLILKDEGDYLLLISSELVTSSDFDANAIGTTWENSDIREFLNNNFIRRSFPTDLAQYIVDSYVYNGDSPYDVHQWSASEVAPFSDIDTIDKVFLPSAAEIQTYFPDNESRKAELIVHYENGNNFSYGPQRYYTRTIGSRGNWGNDYAYPIYVDSDGGIYYNSPRFPATYTAYCRPMIRVSKNSPYLSYSGTSEDIETTEISNLEYLLLSQLVYNDLKVGMNSNDFSKFDTKNLENNTNSQIKNLSYSQLYSNYLYGWEVDYVVSRASGFYAAGFYNKKNDNHVLAFRGSENILGLITDNADAVGDWLVNDIQFQIFHQMTNQLDQTISEAENYAENYDKVSFTGHSLGGGLATIASYVTNENAVVFNPASTLDTVLYSNTYLGYNFHGLDSLKVESHINEKDEFVGMWDLEYKKGFTYKDYSNGKAPHSLYSFLVSSDGINGVDLSLLKVSTSIPIPLNKSIGNFADLGIKGNLLLGSSADDTLSVTPSKNNIENIIYGGDGNDKLTGGNVSDTLIGGSGDDILEGGDGADDYIYFKGDGVDTIIDYSGSDKLKLYGYTGADNIFISPTDEFIFIYVGESQTDSNLVAKVKQINRDPHNTFNVSIYTGYNGQPNSTVTLEFLNSSNTIVENSHVYRLNNRVTGEHLFTTDLNEVKVLSSQFIWDNEGIAWISPKSGEGVYRLFNTTTGSHLYTKDQNEVNVLKTKGWKIDNNNKPLFYSGGNIPIYRLFNRTNGMHLLTIDQNEYNVLGTRGWNQEGISLYGN